MKNLKFFNIFGKLRIWQKLALIAGLLFLTVPVVTWQLVVALNSQIEFSQKEIYGTDYLPAAKKLYEQVAKHRSLAYLSMHGGSGLKDQINGTQQMIGASFQALGDVDSKAVAGTNYGALLETSDRVSALKRDWEAVRNKTLNSNNPQEVFDAHNRLITGLYDLIGLVGDKSNLILDPDLDTFYLMDNSIRDLPEVIDALDQTRAVMAGAIYAKAITPAEQNKLSFESARALSSLQKLEVKFRKSFDANSTNKGDIAGKMQTAVTEAVRDGREVLKQADNFNPTSGNADQLFSSSTKTMDRFGVLYDGTIVNLAELLNKRVNGFKNNRNLTLALVAFGLLLTIAVTLLIVRSINSQVSSLSTLVKQIEVGNVDARAEVLSEDELGALASSFNTTLDNTRGLMQSREERDSIQRSIMRLLEEVSDVAQGDLTREAEVTEDITGAIADSFNFMIIELRRIIGQVKQVSAQVSSTASTTQTNTTDLVQKAEAQTEQITKTTQALEEMTSSIQAVSQGAARSATVAQESLVNARQGAKAVQDTIKGMNRIREQVQETSTSIRRLGESSQEIGEIVQIIDEIADQTAILALNASIQAATAGEAGRGFAVVAEEIEQLAERSSQATAKITSLVKSIQLGTNEAISAMEENSREVTEGSKLALQAGQSLTEIEAVSAHLAELIQSISQASQRQTNSSATLSKAMTDISQIVNETTNGIQESAVTVSSLSTLADDLRTSVSSFKLPGGSN